MKVFSVHRRGVRILTRQWRWDTRAGTIELTILRLRQGSYFPGWLLGVSTRRVEKLAETLWITSLSKSQVPGLAKSLDHSPHFLFANNGVSTSAGALTT